MYIPITKNFTIKVCGRKRSPLLLYFMINYRNSFITLVPNVFLPGKPLQLCIIFASNAAANLIEAPAANTTLGLVPYTLGYMNVPKNISEPGKAYEVQQH